ncbi:MAG: 16S rRNA (uracil(1498)-N(3))-methyltransferase [Deltaproteobacteria bacterium]|nr:16S rRNA (uracil(1498)-N(3))-methyltransferase [Deltaproteobacteria bacterium]
MNLILLFERDRIGSTARFALGDHRADHIRQVLRGEVGQTVRVGLLHGPQGLGRLVEVPPHPKGDASGQAAPAPPIVVECTFESGIESKPRVDLCLAIPRPRVLRRIFPEMTAMGVDRLILFRARRTEKAYLSARILEPEHYNPLLYEGLMQSKTTRPPEVVVEPAFKPFVEDRLPSLIRDGLGFIAHPEAPPVEAPPVEASPATAPGHEGQNSAPHHEAQRPMGQASRGLALGEITVPTDARVVLVVGPEGGFIPYEVARLEAQGLARVSLGPRILRVETACVALLAAFSARRRVSNPPSTD